MIHAVIFDLDNTLMDFMKMKSMSIDAAIYGMIEAGMEIDFDASKKNIYIEYMRVKDMNIKKFLMISSLRNVGN